jgi:hypothetical protein
MKTRQEMIYDFMMILCANAEVFKDWSTSTFELGSYGDHVKALAEEMADKYWETE